MPESETAIVFRIIGTLARAREHDHALVLDEIASAVPLNKPRLERYLTVLQQAGVVRAEASALSTPCYSLTRYGLERMAGAGAP